MTLDVVAIGDSVVDVIIPVPRFLRGNEDSIHSEGMEKHMGGSSNYLIMASRLGLKAGVIDCIGDDDLGAFYQAGLEVEGVDTSRIRVRKGGRTSSCIVILTNKGKHAYIGLEGVSRTLTAEELDENYVASTRAFFMSGYSLSETPIANAVLRALRAAKKAGRYIFFDPSPVADTIQLEALREVVESTDTLILNNRELGLITSMLDVKPQSVSLLNLGAKRVVLKEGADGCSFHTTSGSEYYPGFKVTVVDTTGAGDAFDAAIVYGTLKQWPNCDIATLANAVGALKVGKKAAGRNVPTLNEIKAFLHKRNALSGRL